MPTIYTNCDECMYDDTIEKYKTIKNFNLLRKLHHENIEKEQILMEMGLPKELCEIIIKFSHTTNKCDNCNKTILCETHYKRAKDNGKYYRGIDISMCGGCCRWEVS